MSSLASLNASTASTSPAPAPRAARASASPLSATSSPRRAGGCGRKVRWGWGRRSPSPFHLRVSAPPREHLHHRFTTAAYVASGGNHEDIHLHTRAADRDK